MVHETTWTEYYERNDRSSPLGDVARGPGLIRARSRRGRGPRLRLRDRDDRDVGAWLARVRDGPGRRGDRPFASASPSRAERSAHDAGRADGRGRAPLRRPRVGRLQPLLLRSDRFPDVWGRIREAVRPGGRFAGQLLGDRDSWAPDDGISSFPEAAARDLFDGWTIERFEEEDEDGEACSGPKHWHVFHVVARSPGTDSSRDHRP